MKYDEYVESELLDENYIKFKDLKTDFSLGF